MVSFSVRKKDSLYWKSDMVRVYHIHRAENQMIGYAKLIDLLRSCSGHSRVHRLFSCDWCLLLCVEMLSEIDKAWLIFYQLQNLWLSIHHIFIFEDLFDSYGLTSFSYLSLDTTINKEWAKFSSLGSEKNLVKPHRLPLTLKTLPKAPLPSTCKNWYFSSLLAAFCCAVY